MYIPELFTETLITHFKLRFTVVEKDGRKVTVINSRDEAKDVRAEGVISQMHHRYCTAVWEQKCVALLSRTRGVIQTGEWSVERAAIGIDSGDKSSVLVPGGPWISQTPPVSSLITNLHRCLPQQHNSTLISAHLRADKMNTLWFYVEFASCIPGAWYIMSSWQHMYQA